MELLVNFASQICHENINKPLDSTYLADFVIDLKEVPCTNEVDFQCSLLMYLVFTGNFLEEWFQITPQTHIRKFEEQTALLGVISDIQIVLNNSVDPVDITNDSQQGTRPQVVCSSNFLT